MKTNNILRALSFTILALPFVFPAQVFSRNKAPTANECLQLAKKFDKKNKMIKCTFRGGRRYVKKMAYKSSLRNIGVCWDYDAIVVKQCDCRKFVRTSICCFLGSSGINGCENFRVGDSQKVACNKYGFPKYGLSGKRAPACDVEDSKKACYKKRGSGKVFSAYFTSANTATGLTNCSTSPYFSCSSRQKWDDWKKGKCGPLPEDCGCRYDSCNSVLIQPKESQCYEAMMKDAEQIACFKKNMKFNDKTKCLWNLWTRRRDKK